MTAALDKASSVATIITVTATPTDGFNLNGSTLTIAANATANNAHAINSPTPVNLTITDNEPLKPNGPYPTPGKGGRRFLYPDGGRSHAI